MNDSLAVVMTEKPSGMIAVYGPDCISQTLMLTAQISLRWPVWVLDGGNRFDALWVANYLAQQDVAPESALARIRVSRAFTCHQFAERVLTLPEDAPGAEAPLVMLYPLDTFYDEDVPFDEARRLLNRMWPVLKKRSRAAPVVMALRPPRSERVADRRRFFDVCLRIAAYRLGPDADASRASPLGLFETAPASARRLTGDIRASHPDLSETPSPSFPPARRGRRGEGGGGRG